MHANTNNNSAARVYLLPNSKRADDAERVALTTDPGLFAALQHPGSGRRSKPVAPRQGSCTSAHNAFENVEGAENLDTILRTIFEDKEFNRKYNYSSLFLIGAGSYGYVFRVVSNASGTLENPLYDERYVRLLQTLRRTKSRKRIALLDSYRDSLCLDLVAIKIEALSLDDISFQAANRIQLVKEFIILTELFRNNSSSNALVGFPMPIEFGFLGNQRVAKNLKKVLIFDTHGRPNNYQEAILRDSSILNLTPGDVTSVSYMTMELLGPNLDEWKEFFSASRGQVGRMVFTVQTTLKLMDQFLCRLIVMHRKNMVHLDLKPDNLCMGIGKMTNTVYLLDYGMSRICSDEKPTITMGSRRYMSVGVLNMWPANFMMDIESWFYVLIVLLTDSVPWSDEMLDKEHGMSRGTSYEERILQTAQLKKQFWGDDGNLDRKLLQRVIEKAECHHKTIVPDIGIILTDIYAHIRRMRQDFYHVTAARMHADIRNEDSDLFKRYHTLRKLLLFPYDCDFAQRGSCFAKDKDLTRRQEKRRYRYEMLVYAVNGRNWFWDWDVWFEEEHMGVSEGYARRKHKLPACAAGEKNRSNAAMHAKCALNSDACEECDESDAEEDSATPAPASIPAWMKHYLARVLGHTETTATATAAESTGDANWLHEEANSALVA